MHHPARHRRGFENGDWVAQKSKIMRRGKPRRARSDDRHLLWMTELRFFRKNVDGMTRLRTIFLGQKSLQGAYGYRRIEHTAPASGLAGVAAYSATHRRKGIGLARIPIRLFIPALRNQRDVSPGLGVDGTSLHAREVGLQPVQIHQLAARLHFSIANR